MNGQNSSSGRLLGQFGDQGLGVVTHARERDHRTCDTLRGIEKLGGVLRDSIRGLTTFVQHALSFVQAATQREGDGQLCAGIRIHIGVRTFGRQIFGHSSRARIASRVWPGQ